MNVPLIEASGLRKQDSESIVLENAKFTRSSFEYNDGSIPVVIAAHNEELDLPSTLLSLARSTSSVFPIVVSNGSSDRTPDISHTMGACTIELDQPAKMGALQIGTQMAYQELGHEKVLYTDGDTIVSDTWVEHMESALRSLDDALIVVSGLVLRWHGQSVLADAAKALWAIKNDLISRVNSDRMKLDGPSMAIKFTEAAFKDYMDIDPKLFFYEEQYILDLMRSLGGVAIHIGNEVPISRGDRTESLKDYFSQRGNIEMKVASYRASYGNDFVPYYPTHGFSRQHQLTDGPGVSDD